jgi:protein SPIRAL1 and related proteins
MLTTGDFALKTETGEDQVVAQSVAGAKTADAAGGSLQNNYARPGGLQNVGNFLTDKPSSRVLAAPGGASSVSRVGIAIALCNRTHRSLPVM